MFVLFAILFDEKDGVVSCVLRMHQLGAQVEPSCILCIRNLQQSLANPELSHTNFLCRIFHEFGGVALNVNVKVAHRSPPSGEDQKPFMKTLEYL
jgi:hypothetical protein